jgi:glucose/arabinose dehydrogenase
MNARATTIPRHSSRRPRLAALGGTLLVVALLAPGSTAAARPPQTDLEFPADAVSGSGTGGVVLGGPTTADIAVEQRVGGLTDPVYITHAGDGTGRYFIVEQTGRIKIWIPGSGVLATPFLSLAGKVSGGFEQGLLGLAFHPNYETNRRLYVNFTNLDGDTIVREYKASLANPNRVDTDTKRLVLKQSQPAPNHNGGGIIFGPGGYLFIGMGDGGGDPGNRAQDKGTLLGKMLRINVDGRTGNKGYGIPSSNPYVGERGKNEIWQRGLRNPWRWSFDRANGNLWIGDVGQGTWEELDRAINGSSGPGNGINWGWPVLEGSHCFNPPSGCNTSGKTMPYTEYRQTDTNGRCAVTGGYVYRGERIPDLAGAYIFGDYCRGVLEAFLPRDGRATQARALGPRVDALASFGKDARGELYVLSLAGTVFQIAT